MKTPSPLFRHCVALFALAGLVALLLAVALFYRLSAPVLYIHDRETGQLLASHPLNPRGEFSISFIHSVNQSPVEDYYRVVDRRFQVYQTRYYHFGAGVQTHVEPGQILTHLPDGGMLVSNLNIKIYPLHYNISPVYDHILHIGQNQYRLQDLGIRGVTLSLEPDSPQGD